MITERVLAIVLGVVASLAIVFAAVSLKAPQQPVPPPPPPTPVSYAQGGQPPAQLDSSELSKALEVAQRDPVLSQVLGKTSWRVLHSGPVVQGGARVGAVLVLSLSEPVKLSGEFTLMNGEKVRAHLWTQTITVKVNFASGTVEAIDPSLAKPPSDVVSAEWVAPAKARCSSFVSSLGVKPLKVTLAAVYETGKYPGGLAVFQIEFEGGEYVVSYDVARGVVVREASGPVIKK
ncbi:hypothetical protein IG193_08490 [Infirmifilum lucidum]|uniref:Uncharacterized protein n=1 Tax=Infirmifilum lucidum TaxID=2776706 RepID=A0A7L9FHE9_9CREN|nr:hypothetical protein [Infirmifilum lucidum]QOJ78772.1 hypothetical protein IG193_08490 [Infirmifilum lucidum]